MHRDQVHSIALTVCGLSGERQILSRDVDWNTHILNMSTLTQLEEDTFSQVKIIAGEVVSEVLTE